MPLSFAFLGPDAASLFPGRPSLRLFCRCLMFLTVADIQKILTELREQFAAINENILVLERFAAGPDAGGAVHRSG